MGQSIPKYHEGDIPRPKMSILDNNSKGFVRYRCSVEGKCEKCGIDTAWWEINIKNGGKYICFDCNKTKNTDYNIDDTHIAIIFDELSKIKNETL